MFVEQYFEHRTNTEHVHLLAIELEHPNFAFERSNFEHRTLFDPSLVITFMSCYTLFLTQVQGLPTGNMTIAEKSLLSDALNSRNKIRALIELSEVVIKAILRGALNPKDAIEICKKILEVSMQCIRI